MKLKSLSDFLCENQDARLVSNELSNVNGGAKGSTYVEGHPTNGGSDCHDNTYDDDHNLIHIGAMEYYT